MPKMKQVALKNLQLVFQTQSVNWHKQILEQHYQSLARLLVDFGRLKTLDLKWLEEHIEFPFLPRYKELQSLYPDRGVVLAAGHLGSFELLAQCIVMRHRPISFVVRLFNLKRTSAWWTSVRERLGNKVISREGAFKEVIRDLSAGRDVAILFDQNIKRKHAVFVDWFTKPAATTKAVALAALKMQSPVVVIGMAYLGNDKYKVLTKECNFSALYENTEISNEEKIYKITAEVSNHMQDMILEYPAEWFWLHRRWKTAPSDEAEGFYSKP